MKYLESPHDKISFVSYLISYFVERPECKGQREQVCVIMYTVAI
jgi:hypothetical protein